MRECIILHPSPIKYILRGDNDLLLNSVAGLCGYLSAGGNWPSNIPLLIGVALIGALIGTELAVNRLAPLGLRQVLGLVLVVAGFKMIMTV